MQKLTYFFIAMLLSSCGWRVLENGQTQSHSLPPATRDSVLTVALSNTIPILDSAIVVSHMVIKAPAQKFVDYARFVTYARNEAARMGGNMMKINEFHGLIQTKWVRQAIYTTVYKMKDPDLVRFSAQLDAAEKHYADSMRSVAIVHIRDRDEQGRRKVYFNDSVVTSIRGVGFDGVRSPGQKDLVCRQAGVLKVDPGPPSHLDIEPARSILSCCIR